MASKYQGEIMVRDAIVEWLSRKGYGLNLRVKGTGEHGIDIKVRHKKYARSTVGRRN